MSKHSKKYNDKASKFYNSSEWRSARGVYIAKRIGIDGGVCEMCHSELGYIVDHKVELNECNIDDVYISLSEDNFQYLCHSCHNKKTFRKKSLEDGYFIDDSGELQYSPH